MPKGKNAQNKALSACNWIVKKFILSIYTWFYNLEDYLLVFLSSSNKKKEKNVDGKDTYDNMRAGS